jgi:hypothetical protein
VTGSFTPPNNTLLVACVELDCAEAQTITVTGGGLTWDPKVKRGQAETPTDGQCEIVTAFCATGAPMTVTARRVGTTSSSGRVSQKVYVVTVVDPITPVETVGADNEGGSTANIVDTTSLTPVLSGLLIAADWEGTLASAFDASSNLTQNTAGYAGAGSVCDGYRACDSNVPVSGNLDAAGGTAAHHKWCAILVREDLEPEPAQVYPFAITQRVG